MNNNLATVYVVVASAAIIAILGGTVYAFTRGGKAETLGVETRSNQNADETRYDNTQSQSTIQKNTNNTMDTNATNGFKELIKEDTVIGTGKEATKGDLITVHYTGKLLDGTVFDSSVTRGQPFQFVLGGGMVIQGWDQGFDGMKEGGKRTLKIPSSMAYGSRGAGAVIKPNSDLIFEVELLKVN
jgi:FKBP-type peptidyl-prolyl cis-trans isomerase